jgi:hypothetical protein
MRYILSILLLALTLSASPFFDDDSSTKLAPKLPALEEFDKEILTLCGNWGDSVDAMVFKRVLKGHDRGRLLDELYSRFKKDYSSRDVFLDKLVDIWFKSRGFVHVFCGEPKKGNYLGGLHFFARYNQAYQNGWATLTNHKYQKANNSTYKIGVEFKNQNSKNRVSKSPKSYNLTMNAKDILIEATKAYLYYSKKSDIKSKKAYNWYVKKDKNYNKHRAKLVVKNQSIVTFYPMN